MVACVDGSPGQRRPPRRSAGAGKRRIASCRPGLRSGSGLLAADIAADIPVNRWLLSGRGGHQRLPVGRCRLCVCGAVLACWVHAQRPRSTGPRSGPGGCAWQPCPVQIPDGARPSDCAPRHQKSLLNRLAIRRPVPPNWPFSALACLRHRQDRAEPHDLDPRSGAAGRRDTALCSQSAVKTMPASGRLETGRASNPPICAIQRKTKAL